MSAANYQGADMGPISLSSPDQFNIDIFKTYFDNIKDQINGIRSVISANSETIAETDNTNKLYPVGFTADGNSLKRNTKVNIQGGTITASNFKGNVTGTATSVSKSLTFKSDGNGDTSNSTYNGSANKSISYNSIGANPIVDPSLYSTVYTIPEAGAKKAKTLAWTDYYLAPDRKFVINLSNNNTVAAATLNINSTGAKNIYIDANDDGSVVAVTASNLTKGYYRVSYDSANNRYVFVPISKIKETTSKYACGLMNSLSYNINGAQDTYNGYKPVNLPSIFAPTSAGTSNQVLISNGSGAPSWTDQSNIFFSNGTLKEGSFSLSQASWVNEITHTLSFNGLYTAFILKEFYGTGGGAFNHPNNFYVSYGGGTDNSTTSINIVLKSGNPNNGNLTETYTYKLYLF